MDTVHTHKFVNGQCEICHITPKQCGHDPINIISKTRQTFGITKNCVCGHKIKDECFHPGEYRRGCYDLDEDYYTYCSLCDYIFY